MPSTACAAAELPALAEAIRQLRSQADYARLRRALGRAAHQHRGFWAFSDALHDRYAREQPIDAGVLDYNRLRESLAIQALRAAPDPARPPARTTPSRTPARRRLAVASPLLL